MNQLIIDAGNTRVKAAIYSTSGFIPLDMQAGLSVQALSLLAGKYKPVAGILSSVINIDAGVLKMIKALPYCLVLDHQTPLPFKNKYASPATLGHDRLANAAGALHFLPAKNVLTIDAGTCLKFDFINAAAEYLGGAISPGILLRYKALHQYTGKLPLLEPVTDAELIGNSTEGSIHSGILNGMVEEINGIISRYEKEFDNVQLILTGGDARYFLNHLKKPIFATPELTLRGLQTILAFNYQHGHSQN